MRGRGSEGAVKAGRAYLGDLSLADFGTSDPKRFRRALDDATLELKVAFPENSRYWGLARKGLNIFLRDCLYTIYLCNAYLLDSAESSFEIPLDSLTGEALHKAIAQLPRWRTVRALTPELSDEYQEAATNLAVSKGIARVHLEVFWWGSRIEM